MFPEYEGAADTRGKLAGVEGERREERGGEIRRQQIEGSVFSLTIAYISVEYHSITFLLSNLWDYGFF